MSQKTRRWVRPGYDPGWCSPARTRTPSASRVRARRSTTPNFERGRATFARFAWFVPGRWRRASASPPPPTRTPTPTRATSASGACSSAARASVTTRRPPPSSVPPRAPIAARFACPYLSMPGVDDCGFVDESFFVALGDAPTLRDVCERAAEWLEGRHVRDEGGARGGGGGDDALNGGGGDERSKPPSPTTFSASSPLRVAWLDAAAHTRRKSDVIDAFRAASASSSFASAIRTDATFASDWFVPAFRPLVDAARRGDDAGDASRRSRVRGVVRRGGGARFGRLFVRPSRTFRDESSHGVRGRVRTFGVSASAAQHDERRGRRRERDWSGRADGRFARRRGGAVGEGTVRRDGRFSPTRSITTTRSSCVTKRPGGGDASLDMHHDASEVTLNVCLGRGAFEGSGLRFCGRFGSEEHRRETCELRHAPGRAVIHLGRQRHGADVISAGERVNLIVWARSSAFRAAAAFGRVDPDGYPRAKEIGEPDRLCLSRANDDDYERKIKAFDATTGR